MDFWLQERLLKTIRFLKNARGVFLTIEIIVQLAELGSQVELKSIERSFNLIYFTVD